MHTTKPKVVFIGGYGRSGSTLLERLLGNREGCFAIGELRHIWGRSFRENQLCGCGKPFNECDTWNAIREDAFPDPAVIKEAAALRRSVDDYRYMPWLFAPKLAPKSFQVRLERYTEILEKLFHSISKITGAHTLIDSSKGPIQGLVLKHTRNIQLHAVQIVRDPCAVAWSWQRARLRPEIHWKGVNMPTFSPGRTALVWNVRNFLTRRVFRRLSSSSEMRYEDLVRDPAGTLSTLFQILGDRGTAIDWLDGHTADLKGNHSVSGNPMRFKTGAITIRQDDEWRRLMPPSSKALVRLLTGCRHRSSAPPTVGKLKEAAREVVV